MYKIGTQRLSGLRSNQLSEFPTCRSQLDFPLDAPLATIGRWDITKEKRAEIITPVVEKFASPYRTAGGRKLDLALDGVQKARGEEEFVYWSNRVAE